MTVMPSGPFEVGDRDGVLRCFDATAGSVYAWLCRLIGGESGAATMLAAVYLRLDDQRTLGWPASVDGLRLEATAFAVAASTSDAAEAAPRVLDAAVADLAIRQHRDPSEIAAIVGVSLAALDRRIADVRSRFGTGGAGTSPIFDGGWLDDVARSMARSAIEDGHLDTLRSPAPRAPLGADRPASPTPAVGGGGRSRRIVVIAVAAVVALLLAASWWTSDSGRSSKTDGTPLDLGSPNSNATTTDATDPPSTVHVVTTSQSTEPATSVPYNGVPLRLSPGYTIQPPAGMQPTGLYETLAAENQQDLTHADSWLQVWAEPEAVRNSGRWLAMSTSTDAVIGDIRSGWTRVAGEGFEGLQQMQPDGVVSLDVRVIRSSGDIGVSLVSFGIATADLERIAMSLVHFEPATAVSNQQLLGAAFEPSSAVIDVMRGMEVVQTGPAWCCGVYSAPTPADSRTVSYSTAEDPLDGAWLSVQTTDGIITTPLDRFLTGRSTDPLAPTNPTATMLIGDRVVHISGNTWTDGGRTITSNTATWVEGGRTIAVSGVMSLTDLLDTVQTARPATTDAWLQLNEQVTLQQPPDSYDPYSEPLTGVGSVDLGDDSTWSMTVSTDARIGQLSVSGGGQNTGNIVWFAPDRDEMLEYDTTGATGIVAVLHDVISTEAQLRVTVPGRAATVVPLFNVEGTNVWVGFDAFAQLPPYTVEQIDTTGATVRTLTP